MYSDCTGAIIEGPSNVTYLPGLTPLPIELTCNASGLILGWRLNRSVAVYTLGSLTNGVLPGHGRRGTNILVNIPVNNTEYICVSQTNNFTEISSDPADIIIAGEYDECQTFVCLCVRVYSHMFVCVYCSVTRNLKCSYIYS